MLWEFSFGRIPIFIWVTETPHSKINICPTSSLCFLYLSVRKSPVRTELNRRFRFSYCLAPAPTPNDRFPHFLTISQHRLGQASSCFLYLSTRGPPDHTAFFRRFRFSDCLAPAPTPNDRFPHSPTISQHRLGQALSCFLYLSTRGPPDHTAFFRRFRFSDCLAPAPTPNDRFPHFPTISQHRLGQASSCFLYLSS